MWTWTCRAGFEDDLVDELRRADARLAPRKVAPARVDSDGRPREWPVFARMGFPVGAEAALVEGPGGDAERVTATAAAIASALDRAFAGKPRSWLPQAWVPDADETNTLSARVEAITEAALAALARTRPDLDLRKLPGAAEARRLSGLALQICMTSPTRILCGALPATDLPTLAPGGRVRAHLPKDAPSRAGRKLVEAFEWIGRTPEAGEVCVDLGAAPGGWSVVLLEHRAKVIAVDPAELTPELRNRKGLTHLKQSAFEFTPTEPVDWLLCDMAWRPMEVAQLLAKWGRRRLAQTLVANIKLPMKQRVEFVARVRETVAQGGWQDVRARQLYHDREEVTLAAWRI